MKTAGSEVEIRGENIQKTCIAPYNISKRKVQGGNKGIRVF